MEAKLDLGKLSAEDISAYTGGTISYFGRKEGNEGRIYVTSVATDSREAGPGSLFCAICGDRADGHDYIAKAVLGGCCCVMAEKLPDGIENTDSGRQFAVIKVDNTVAAIGRLASAYSKLKAHKTVAVTGSVGKTTTKEYIYSVLSQTFRAQKSEENHNNELGMSMTLLSMRRDTEIMVLEMGMSGFGEIERLSTIAEPDIAVITIVGSSHLEQLGSRENICRAKMEILKGLKKNGALYINGDDLLLTSFDTGDVHPVLCSLRNRDSEFRALNIRSGSDHLTFDVIYNAELATNVEIKGIGTHNVNAALFAFAVGVRMGMKESEIRRGLLAFKNAGMRQDIYEYSGVTFIEDCYNASPESMEAALGVLSDYARTHGGKRRLALLGDMRELGENSRLMHYQVGKSVARSGLQLLFTYGVSAENIAHGAIEGGMRADNVFVNLDCENPEATAQMIIENLRPGDVLLVKASRAIAAEKVVALVKERLNAQK